MATEIVQINTEDFSLSTYEGSDINLIDPIELDTFLSSSSYIEYFIYDNNQNILNSIYNFTNYSVQNNGQSAGNGGNLSQIILDPEASLIGYGYDQGEYISYYNILNNQIGSNLQQLYITEISSDRTEIRLDSTSLTIIDIVEQTDNFIQQRLDSSYFLDFYLNFGENILSIANNIQLDTLDPANPTIIVKLYEALPDQFDINDTLWIVTLIDEPLAYQVTFEDPIFVVNDTVQISGPNFNLDLKNQVNNSTGALSYSDLISTPLTSSLNQLNSLLEEKEIDINIDYTDFNDFIHFSSAQTRLENFYYKVSLIEQYSSSLSTLSLISNPSSTVLNDQTSYENKINDLITNFDGYEYYLYFESSSYAWPKSNTEKPYLLFTTSSTEVIDWLGSTNEYSPIYGGMYLSSSIFDENNKDNLLFTIPEYLREDSENNQYSLFVEMVAQHYDNIWIYYKDVTQKYNADNRLENGISKDIVADAIRDFGIKLYQNNFSNEDLYTAFLGLTPEGALFPFPNITGSLPTPSGYEYVDTLISASNDYMPLDDVNKSLYKRIYHNLPYLLKSKGTIPGLRALITSYGIPDTILRINEYGGKDKVNTNDWDYWQNEFNYSYYNSGSNTIETPWVLNPSWNSPDDVPSTLEFRFKIKDLELVSGSSPQTLWENENSTTLQINYTGSGYSSGSYSGSIIDPTYQYAELNLYPDLLGSPNISASIYLPICDENWWSVMITRDNDDFTLYSGNKIYEGGNNGTTLGFFQSSSVNLSTVSWVNSTTSTFMSSVDGYLQEIRYYTTVLNENVFKDYIMNPYSIEGNSINSTPNELAFRAALGGELYTSSISIHPKITGSWDVTSSFTSDSDFIYVGTPIFNSNEEYFFYDQPVVGIKNAVSDKIRLENSVIPEGNTLSPLRSLSQNLAASQSYTINTNLLEVAFSPQDEINDDINSSIGFFNIGDYIGDPSLRSSPDTSYPALDKLRNDYFEKYTKNYKLNDFIRLIKFFDNSLFKMIKDFVPARTSLASGIIIKQHLLERNKYPQPQMIWESLDILGTLKPQWNNYNEGTVENFSGGTGGQLEKFNSVSNISQSWNVINQTSLGITTTLHDSQDEFYNGEFSGSVLTVTTQSLNQPYPNPNLSFFYTPVIYSNDNYVSPLASNFTENQFLNSLTVPSPGEILMLKPWYSTTSKYGIPTSFYGDAYLKVHKLDNNGANNTIVLGQINNLLIKYSSSPSPTTFNILEKTEYSNYYLFKVNNTTLVDDYIEDYNVSSSTTSSLTLSGPNLNTLVNFSQTIGNINNYFNTSSGNYTSSITNNVALYISASAIFEGSSGGSANFIIKVTNVNGTSTDLATTSSTITMPNSSMSLTTTYYAMPGDSLKLQVQRNSGTPIFLTGSINVSQSSSPSPSESDTVIFEPYITTVNYYNSDLNPIINNAVYARQSTIWDDLDYTQGDLKPVNFGIILSGGADKAYVQDSNYTLKRHTNPRYEGSRSTSQRLNTWSPSNTIPGYSDIGTYGKLPTIENNTTTILEFELGGGAYPEIASAGGIKISQMLNVNSTNSVDKFLPSLEYFTDVLEKTFLPNSTPLIKQYTTDSSNTSGAKIMTTKIGVPSIGNYIAISSDPISQGSPSSLTELSLSPFLKEVSLNNGAYSTGSASTTDIRPLISGSIVNGDKWYITIYNYLPDTVQGTLQPFNSGSSNNYSLTDGSGNYLNPITKNGVYEITGFDASSVKFTISPPFPEIGWYLGQGNKGALIWKSIDSKTILFNDATFSGVGKGCLVPPNASSIINDNLEYITKTYGINN